jgi:Protein of unknown function (DUF4238)
MARQKKRRTETQHYVSQFYLRGFVNATGRMFCYDKAANLSHPTSTEAAAQEPYFYEIPPGSFQNNVNMPLNTVEKALAVVERTWAPLHAQLIKCADDGHLPSELIVSYAFFLFLQWMRTKTYRDTLHEVAQKTMQAHADDLIAANYPGEKATVTVGKELSAAIHYQELFDWDTVQRKAAELERHYWVVGLNQTDHLFYTSDHPVVRRGNRRNADGRLMVGILDPGIEFVFPLDSRHILLILERTHFAQWRKHDNRAISLTSEQVRDYNGLQVMRSCQRIYSANDDFGLARELCSAHPEIRNPNRSRVVVETTPIILAGVGEDGKERWKNKVFVTALE